MSSRRRDCVVEIRLLGKGRWGLFRVSSRTEEGKRWLAMLKIRRLVQMKRMMEGMRRRAVSRFGDVLVLSTPEREPKRANSMVGIVKVEMSAAVKR